MFRPLILFLLILSAVAYTRPNINHLKIWNVSTKYCTATLFYTFIISTAYNDKETYLRCQMKTQPASSTDPISKKDCLLVSFAQVVVSAALSAFVVVSA